MKKDEVLETISARTLVEEEFLKWKEAIPDIFVMPVVDLYAIWLFKTDKRETIYLTNEMASEMDISELDLLIAYEQNTIAFLKGWSTAEDGTKYPVFVEPEGTICSAFILPLILSDFQIYARSNDILIIPFQKDVCGIATLDDEKAIQYFQEKRRANDEPYIPKAIYRCNNGDVSIYEK